MSATNVLISDTLPGGLTLAGAVYLDPPGSGIIGTLPTLVTALTITPDEQITVTFPVTVSASVQQGIILTNTAAVSSAEVLVPLTTTAIITITTNPAITISKQAHLTTVTVGQTITYTYRVTNTGDVSLSNLTASDIPLGPIPLNKTSLLPNQSATGILTYTVFEDDLPGPLTNTAIVTSTFQANEITVTTQEVVALTYNATMTLSKAVNVATASVGETITYTYRVTNTGNVSLTNLVVDDTPLGTFSLNKNSLSPGLYTTRTLTYTVVEGDLPGPLISTAIVTGTFHTNKVTATASISVTLLESNSNNQVYLPTILKKN